MGPHHDGALLMIEENLETPYFTAKYEQGTIRYIKSGNVEVIRMIYPAVRDRNWGTLNPEIVKEDFKKTEDGFQIKVWAKYQKEEIKFEAFYLIAGEKNRLIFEMTGKAQSSFLSNRTGLCVLHPIKECAGKICTVMHSNGTEEKAVFPELISPNQPMKNISVLEWAPAKWLQTELHFSGEVFEMEDQRNWTDASYKTYCRPLELPFPFKIKKGEKIRQKIELILKTPLIEKQKPEPVIFHINHKNTFLLPELGTCASSRREPLTQNEAAILRELPFSHLRAEIKLFEKNWKSVLSKVMTESSLLNLPLFLVLYFSNGFQKELAVIKRHFQHKKPNVKYFLVVGKNHLTDELVFDAVVNELKILFPGAKTGAGVNAYFAELNRNRPKPANTGFISFTICPQVHASDNASLTENLEAQKYAVESAKEFFPGLPVFVSPVTLKQRFNVVATADEPLPPPGELPPQVDIRQNTVFAARWLLGSIKYLAQSGASLSTFFETVGWRGFIQGDFNPPVPGEFIAEKGDTFPVFALLKEFTGFKNVLFCESNFPLEVDGIVLQNKREVKLILANFSEQPKEVQISPEIKITKVGTLFKEKTKAEKNKIYLPPNNVIVITS